MYVARVWISLTLVKWQNSTEFGWLQQMKGTYKMKYYPYHVWKLNITPFAECADGIAKPAEWRHTHSFSMGMTSLYWLCYPIGMFGTWHNVQLSHGEDNQILFYFLINTTTFWIKIMNMYSIITSIHNMKIFTISIVLL